MHIHLIIYLIVNKFNIFYCHPTTFYFNMTNLSTKYFKEEVQMFVAKKMLNVFTTTSYS